MNSIRTEPILVTAIEQGQDHRLAILHHPVNEQLKRVLNSEAELRGLRPRDLLHEILCVSFKRYDLLPYSPRALEPKGKDNPDGPEQRQAS